jgi:hypothetical protein
VIHKKVIRTRLVATVVSAAVSAVLVLGTGTTVVSATEPCGDFGECKALIEINATDGDIGFHFLMDGDDLVSSSLVNPNGDKVFQDRAKGPLAEQKKTETFIESAEPLCWRDPDADPEEEIVTLEEFLQRWVAGTYVVSGKGDQGEKSMGETPLTHELPAAPSEVDFVGGVISWDAGEDLGNCASNEELDALVMDDVLPVHPEDVNVVAWEVVLEPDVEDGDPTGKLVFSIRVPGDIAPRQVTVPNDYLASLPDNTPVKIEVGAIGAHDNATFTEEVGFCINESGDGCE